MLTGPPPEPDPQELKTCHRYYFIEPVDAKYRDDKHHPPITTFTVVTTTKTYTMALFGRPDQLRMFRIGVPDVMEQQESEEDLRMIQLLKEHMAAILRLTYDKDIRLASRTVWAYQSPTAPYRFNLDIEPVFISHPVNYDNIRNSFVSGFPLRHEVKLLTDALDENIPLQYRFLSLYKLLELRFKSEGQWRSDEYETFLKEFSDEWQALKISPRTLRNYIEDVRDRCAHVRTRSDALGVTTLSNKDAVEINSVLPFPALVRNS